MGSLKPITVVEGSVLSATYCTGLCQAMAHMILERYIRDDNTSILRDKLV